MKEDMSTKTSLHHCPKRLFEIFKQAVMVAEAKAKTLNSNVKTTVNKKI